MVFTIRPSRPVSAFCLFTSIEHPTHGDVTPEIYARPNNEVYACGEGDHLVPLPTSTDLVQVDESRCRDIVTQVSSISGELRGGEVLNSYGASYVDSDEFVSDLINTVESSKVESTKLDESQDKTTTWRGVLIVLSDFYRNLHCTINASKVQHMSRHSLRIDRKVSA